MIMRLEINENKLNMIFEISEDNALSLLHFSTDVPQMEIGDGAKKHFTASDIHVTGKNQNDHHGAKHTGSSSISSLKYSTHKYYRNESGKKLEITLCDEELEATLHYQFYDNISVARAWTVVRNITDHPAASTIGLEYVSSFCLTGIGNGKAAQAADNLLVSIPHNAWVREVDWQSYTPAQLGLREINGASTKRFSVTNSGTWATKEYLPMGAITDTKAKTCLMWQIEHNGSWQWEFSDICGYFYLKVSGPTENENHWHKELAPGECFESVKAAITVGTSFDDALAQMTSYRRKIVRYNKTDAGLPVIFNDYMNCIWADPTTDKLLPVIDKAAETGAEYYCMDAGWYADGTWWETVGEWQPCSWRFPGGMKEVFDYIREKGMIPGIWLEIEVMGINCPILSQFTDDCFFMRHGKRVIDHGRYQLDFRNQKVRNFATGVIDRLVSEYGVGYIKMDYNIDGGIGTENNADSFGDGLLGHNRAYLKWMESIMDKYPELVIENCSSGGMRMDYAQLSLHSIQSVTDQSDYKKMIPIAAAAASAALPEQAAIWSYPVSKDDMTAVATNMVNSMLLRMHLSGEIMNLDPEQLQLVKDGVACYKEIRTSIANSLPFYPLGIESYGKDWVCAGYKGESASYLTIWKLDSEDTNVQIPVDEYFKDAELIYPLNPGCIVEKKGRQLIATLPEKFSGVIVKLH